MGTLERSLYIRHLQLTMKKSLIHYDVYVPMLEAPWPSGRASDSGARGRGSILTQVAVLCP